MPVDRPNADEPSKPQAQQGIQQRGEQQWGDQLISPPTAAADATVTDATVADATVAASSPDQAASAPLRAIYYTDPLCSWSWGFEPQWRRLRYELGAQIQWRYRMGGMIADWQHYSDPLNDVSRPVQMGPQWFQVRELSGMPIEERIWFEDPPSSSYPACIAVKAAAQQGAHQGERYLRRVREAVMVERRNVALRQCLLDLAHDLANTAEQQADALDVARFTQALSGEEALAEFRSDLQDTRYRDIGRFPTLALLNQTGSGIMLVGYRPYDALRGALTRWMPDLAPVRQATDAVAYARYWGRITLREVMEALEQERAQVEQALQEGVAQGLLTQQGIFYESSVPQT